MTARTQADSESFGSQRRLAVSEAGETRRMARECRGPAVSESFKTALHPRRTMRRMNTSTASTTAALAPASSALLRPPGPPARWWGIPLLRAMRRDYVGFTAGLRSRWGDITYMRLGNEHAYDIFSPELVRSALVDNASALVRWERGMEVFEQLFGRSVLVSEGATWQRQRRMLMPAFTPKKVAGYAGLMVEAARCGLDAALDGGEREGLVDMDALFTRIAMDVVLRALFSSGAAQETRDASQAVRILSDVGMREMFMPLTLPDWLPLPGKAAKRSALRTLRGLVGGHIAKREAAPAGPHQDLLAMLMAVRDEDGGGAGLRDQELFDQCMVTFQAGHETSATALLWWSRQMAEHPEALRRANEEIGAHLQGRAPAAADLADLPWLTATLKEAMRLYPPIAALMTRRTTREVQLGPWRIPRGALLRLTPWVLHRDPRAFEQPERFLPERFLDAAADPSRAWMAFGTGPRVCIGQHFAMLEMTLIAALLLQRYDLALPEGAGPCEPVMNVTLRPRGGVTLRLTRKTSPHEHITRNEP